MIHVVPLLRASRRPLAPRRSIQEALTPSLWKHGPLITVAAYIGSAPRRTTLTPKSSVQTKASDSEEHSEYVIYEKPPRWYMKAIWLGVLMNVGIV